jgi:hypothetical protein
MLFTHSYFPDGKLVADVEYMQPMKKLALLALTLALPLFGAESNPTDNENPHAWKPRVSSVTVFKNGLGFFLRDGEIALRDGWCVAGEVPPAHFGTLAIYSHTNGEVVDVVGAGPGEIIEFDGVDAPKDVAAKRARLEASRYLKLQLTYTQKETDRTSAGKLVSIGPDFAILETDNSSFAVPIEGLKKMQILERPLRIHISSGENKSPAKTTLGMAYLSKGITWIPEYSLKLLDDDTAELNLRGTLVNEAEDLVHADVNFVVGVPHFVHTDYLAPIAVGQVIRTIGAATAPRQVMSQIANSAFANVISNGDVNFAPGVTEQSAGGARDVRSATGNLPVMESAGATDFTVYTRKDITLRRGEKAIVTLFTKKIKYSHIYRWAPPEALQHFLSLENGTDTAWTTGPCLALSKNGPLSEDILKYTPKGSVGEFPITSAINVAQDQNETEVDRKLRSHEPSDKFWVDLVTMQGELKIKNLEKSAITLVVTTKIAGKPITVSDDGTTTVNSSKLQLMDREATVRWKVKIDPGQTKTLTYKYERYVPSK